MPNWCLSRDAVLAFSICDVPHLSPPLMVDDNVLLKDVLVCHTSHILQPHALYSFHFDKRIPNDLDV